MPNQHEQIANFKGKYMSISNVGGEFDGYEMKLGGWSRGMKERNAKKHGSYNSIVRNVGNVGKGKTNDRR